MAEATVFMFCGKLISSRLVIGGGGTSSMEGKRRSFVASSVLSHLRTGGFSFIGLSVITIPSDSDLLTLELVFCRMIALSDSISVSEISDILGEDMGDTMSRVLHLMAALFFWAASALLASVGTEAGGGGETLLSEDTLTCVDEGESSRILASSFSATEATEAKGLLVGTTL